LAETLVSFWLAAAVVLVLPRFWGVEGVVVRLVGDV
jgi:hypothetical protein